MKPDIHLFEDYLREYERSILMPEIFWEEKAERFVWRKRWDKVLEGNFQTSRISWFSGGRLNITENCLDRHVQAFPDRTALMWEPNSPSEQSRRFSYKELYIQVCKTASSLKKLGVTKGDRVCIYMPPVPEAVIAMLACARLGAVHSVVFAGFSSNSLTDRIHDCSAKLLITADGAYRGSKKIPLKTIVDNALSRCTSVQTCIVFRRTGETVSMSPGRDLWWHDMLEKTSDVCTAEIMDAEDPLFILYTSGSTGSPKGLVHTVGGYMVYTDYTFSNVFQYKEGEVYWCTADIGWITGHSYIVYGPLCAGATVLMYEGTFDYPHTGRWWEIIEKYSVNIFYTAPTAIRALEALGNEHLNRYAMNSLRVLGSVGEPINEEAWHWYYKNVGKNRCPITDTWWQTETGGIMIAPVAGVTPLKPSFATLPLPGIRPVIIDEQGIPLRDKPTEGSLCIEFPWPGMARTIYGDAERYHQTYFSIFPGMYFTGDGCRKDEDGYYRILGRVDDVINVSGHRLGTAEIESAVNEHPAIVESAAVGYSHPVKGQAIYIYAIAENEVLNETTLKEEIKATVVDAIGAIARPEAVQIVRDLPKTRSGKIMRRILRKIAEGNPDFGDSSTLADPAVAEEIFNQAFTLKEAKGV